MPNEIISKAMAEAYAVAPSNEIILHTLELRHPEFIDKDGNPTPIRVVKDTRDLWAYLEATAPINAGERVRFRKYPFTMDLPKISDNADPAVAISIDNVSLEMIDHISRAVESESPVMVTYRPYLLTDTSHPSWDPPLHLTLTDVSANALTISGRAGYAELPNRSFPGRSYNPTEFRGLAR